MTSLLPICWKPKIVFITLFDIIQLKIISEMSNCQNMQNYNVGVNTKKGIIFVSQLKYAKHKYQQPYETFSNIVILHP